MAAAENQSGLFQVFKRQARKLAVFGFAQEGRDQLENTRDGFDLCGSVFEAVSFEYAGERDPVSDREQEGIDQ